MGYLDCPLVQGYNLFAPTFEGVAKSLSIQDIKLNGSEGWASDMIFVLDDAGLLTGQSFSWNCPDNGFDDWCWVDSETGEPAVLEITEGMGFYLYADADELSIQCAGQVKVGDYCKPLAQGYNITGNFCPTDLSIQQIVLDGSEGWASDMIFVLDDAGLLTGQSFSWNCPDNGFDDWCWVDSETGEPAVATIKAGQGLYLYADTDGLSLKLPAVIPAPAAE